MIDVTEADQILHRGKVYEIKTIEEEFDDGVDTGEYRDRITIQRKTRIKDGEGGFMEVWIDVVTVWAKVRSIWAKQQYENKSVGVEATHRIEIRGKKIITCRELR